VDLDDPFSPPRWLHHMTSWEVADVQWSPHATKTNWVISTSNQKALVWNLALPSNRAIEHMLHGHKRAITDINFHALHPEVLATCSIDSYIHVWDLRDPKKPSQSFADWRAGATQVKWNRWNENVLASSHDNKVYIWDRRKGTIPLHTLQSHTGKVNGLDFSRLEENKILSCSNDRTVKLWDYERNDQHAEKVIFTNFPVWRARHTPFGEGCAIMPLRGGQNNVFLCDLKTAGARSSLDPVYEFQGHSEPVKEFVWRSRGGNEGVEDRQFQLVTWSKDHDLRLWPVPQDILEKVHYVRGAPLKIILTRKGAPYKSFQTEPNVSDGIHTAQYRTRHKQSISYGSSPVNKMNKKPGFTSVMTGNTSVKPEKDGISHLHWISGVRMGRSAFAAPFDNSMGAEVPEQGEASPGNLGEEVSIVGHKFPRISFEKISVSTGECIVSLNGPWGEPSNKDEDSQLVFLRLEINFPPTYPFTSPSFTIRDSDNIMEEKAENIIHELNGIAQKLSSKGHYCLELCLRYLLGDKVSLDEFEVDELTDDKVDSVLDGSMDELIDLNNEFNNSSSSEDEGLDSTKPNPAFDSTPVPKGCGAVWSKGGQLVCFFTQRKETQKHFPKSAQGDVAKGLSNYQGGLGDEGDSSDSLDSDSDMLGDFDGSGVYWPLGNNRLRNHFRIPQLGSRTSRGVVSNTERSQGTYQPRENNVIKLYDFSHLIPSRRDLAREYKIIGASPSELAGHNMAVAKKHGCKDVADCWRIISLILSEGANSSIAGATSLSRPDLLTNSYWGNHPFGSKGLIDEMFQYFEREKNTQMLANMSCILSGRTTENRMEQLVTSQTPSVEVRSPRPLEGLSREPSSGYFNNPSAGLFVQAQSSPWDIPSGSGKSSTANFDSSPASSKDDSSIMSLSPEKFMTARKAVAGIFTRSGGSNPSFQRAQSVTNGRNQASSSGEHDYNLNIMFNSGAATRLTSRNSFYGSDSGITYLSAFPKVKVEMLNDSVLDYDRGAGKPNQVRNMLDPAFEEKYKLYRAQYAAILYSWGLEIDSLEVLKFNHTHYRSIRGSSMDIHSAQINFRQLNQSSEGFEMMQGASNSIINRTLSQMCHYCELIVRTRFLQCPRCEHVLHAQCAEEWWGNGQEVECASGCGCYCFQIC
jgi:WD40 repeat protein